MTSGRRRQVAAGVLLAALWFGAASAHASDGVMMSGTHRIPRDPAVRPAAHRPIPAQSAPSFRVGDPLTVRAFDFGSVKDHYLTTTTCRLVGERCYIFVEDVVENSPRVTADALASIAEAFDASTPGDPTRGIFEVEESLFGPVPDVDGDPRIIIVVLDVLDFSFTGVSFVGYFDVENQVPPVSREILFLDMNPLDLGSDLAKATLAHEFQHMIHWLADPDESKWVDEGCSEYAELATGYKDTGPEAGSAFLEVTNTSLTVWEDLAFDFDQTFLFSTYLAQRAGEGFFRDLVAEAENGIAGLDRALENRGSSLRFADVFADWSAALYLDAEGDRGLEAVEVGPLRVDTLAAADGQVTRTIRLWGIDYLALDEPGGLTVTVSAVLDNTLSAVLIGEGPAGAWVKRMDVGLGKSISIGSYGTEARALAVMRTSGIVQNYRVSLAPADGTEPSASDFDASGRVNFEDFLRFVGHFGQKPSSHLDYDPAYDLDGDGRVAFGDFLVFAGNFGKTVG